MKVVKTLAAATIMAFVTLTAAQAATVINQTSGLSDPDTLITFDEGALADGTSVSNQFDGVSFSAGIQINTVTYPFPNVPGRSLRNFFPIAGTVSIFFDADLTDATFSMITNTGISSFTALLDGQEVQTFRGLTTLNSTSNFFGFADILFDEIRIAVGGFNSAMLLDNLAYNVETPPTVPLPASLPLMLGGLAAFGVMRVRRKNA
ncbi:VPLPA-CTERM sorting domain-containing protein [Tateyamaria sp.]|uniref:VPLPA-CTERM sorting domain-containing protein n=1 Tax=Tateyamaria sp. TaxID=1929288 RepID=UPI00329F0BFF